MHSNEENCDSGEGISFVYVAGAAALIGARAVVAAPVVITSLGFTSGGIAAGSYAATMMSTQAPTVAGGVVATCQSLGAAGMTVGAKSAVFSAGAAVGGSVSALWQWANEDWGFSEFVYRPLIGGLYITHEFWLTYIMSMFKLHNKSCVTPLLFINLFLVWNYFSSRSH